MLSLWEGGTLARWGLGATELGVPVILLSEVPVLLFLHSDLAMPCVMQGFQKCEVGFGPRWGIRHASSVSRSSWCLNVFTGKMALKDSQNKRNIQIQCWWEFVRLPSLSPTNGGHRLQIKVGRSVPLRPLWLIDSIFSQCVPTAFPVVSVLVTSSYEYSIHSGSATFLVTSFYLMSSIKALSPNTGPFLSVGH
jgi:hypothetical protein